MFRKSLQFILVLLLLTPVFLWAQELKFDPAFEEQKVFEETQRWLKSATFKENESYADYDLTFQRMDWEVDPSVRYIKGAVSSWFVPKTDNFNRISFDLADELTVDSIRYHQNTISFEHANNQILIILPEVISINEIDSLGIWYHGVPPEREGAFVTSVTGKGDPILWTLSEPYGAMLWWPCKQSLVDKVDSLEVKVTCPAGNKVASNGKLISEKTVGDKTTVIWRHDHPIATYLVAIAVTNYVEFTDTLTLKDSRKIPILNYVYPDFLETAKQSTQYTLDIMSLFNELIGEYPFANEKYGHAQFGWGGGMEHQTMSFMANLNFSLVAHEMAHQWFGDCLTLNSWHDIWLNEGFATYLTGLCFENLLDSANWKAWKDYRLNHVTSSPSGSVYVQDTTNINRIFDSRLSYSKGGYLLHMLRGELGDEAFFKGMQDYFNDPKVKYGFASQQDFVSHMEAAGDTSLTEFFNDWYYGQGYPQYQLSYFINYADNGNYYVSINQNTSDPSVNFFEMHVPIRVWRNGKSTDYRFHQTQNGQQFRIGERPDSIQFDPDLWLISKNNSIIAGIPEQKSAELTLFPNPVKNELTIVVDSLEAIQQIIITDLNGKITLQLDNLPTAKINVSNLAAGTYIIQLKTKKGFFYKKFVKIN